MATGWLGALLPPNGTLPNFENPPSQRDGNIALHTVCLTLATLSVVVRLYTRSTITKSKLGIDDLLCTFAYVCTIAFSGVVIKGYTWGIGRHMWDTPAIWIPYALKYFTIAQYIFHIISCAVKLSFLIFYHRIFAAQDGTRHFIIFGIFFVACSHVALLFATIFACAPVARAWNFMLPGRCFNVEVLPYISGGLNLATDLYILVLPMRSLWRLTLSRGRKIRLLAIFGLGGFACIASLIRLAKTSVLQSSADATWNISKLAIWAVIEVNVGIICSSSTLLPAFFDRHWPKAINTAIARFFSCTTSRSTAASRSGQLASGRYETKQTQTKNWASHDFAELRDGDDFPVVIHNTSKGPNRMGTVEV